MIGSNRGVRAAAHMIAMALQQHWLRQRLERARSVLSFASRRASEANLTQVAASLTFSTVLSMVPLLAVALALFTAFTPLSPFRNELERHLLRDLLPQPFAGTILRYLDDFASKATRVGAAGLFVFVVSALTTALTIDHALNDVWRVRARRALVKRVLVYGVLIILGPVIVGASLTLSSMVASISLGWMHEVRPAARSALSFAPLLFSCAAFTALYIVVPNRRVDWRDALTGGIVAGVLAETLSRSFALYISRGSVLSVYGAFAVVPVFLLWVYFSWLTVLFGAAIAATVSELRATRFSDELKAGNRFLTAVGLLKLLFEARSEVAGAEWSTQALARRIRSGEEETRELLTQMQALGYVRAVSAGRPSRSTRWTLAGDPERTDLAALFHRFGIDPENALMSPTGGLGLESWLAPVLRGAWLHKPLSQIAAQAREAPEP